MPDFPTLDDKILNPMQWDTFIAIDAAAMGRSTRLTGTGNISISANELGLFTGATNGSYAEAVWGPATSFKRRITFMLCVCINMITDHIFEFGLGWPWLSTANTDRTTIEIEDGVIKGKTADGVNTGRTTLKTLTVAELGIMFTIDHFPGVKEDFYVDGVLLGTRTANLPRTTYSCDLMCAMVYNKAAANKGIYINPGVIARVRR